MKNLLIICLLSCLTGCVKIDNPQPSNYAFGGGVYIVNEGNFGSGNGTLSLFSYDSLKVYNDLFRAANNRPLGDVPNSMTINSGKAYIVVNNSGKIEIADAKTLVSQGVISGLNSPRNLAFANSTKAYVTSLYSDSIAIIDLNSNTISGYINAGGPTEAIMVDGTKAYVTNWTNGNTVRVINVAENRVIDTIIVGSEPESIVIDRNNRLWVLCPGSWRRDVFAELDVINLGTGKVEKKFTFPDIQNSPSCLKIDAMGQTLYYINKGVYKMDVTASSLPVTPLIPENNAYFYKIAVNPVNSDILVTDAGDFMHDGYISVYKNDGTLFKRDKAGLIPGSMAFNLVVIAIN